MKDKIACYGGIFLMFMGVVLFLVAFFSLVDNAPVDKLKVIEGAVVNLHNKNYSKGALNDLYIYLDVGQEPFLIQNVSKLRSHNGCYLTSIKTGDKIRIFYDPNDSSIFGEKNIVWKIETSEKVIISDKDMVSVNNSLQKYYMIQSLIFIVIGFLLFIAPSKMPWLLARR